MGVTKGRNDAETIKTNVIVMCTYSISIDDSVMENVRPAFPDEESLSRWMQQQMELLMIRYAATLERPTSKSQRLRGIATAPNNQELETILASAKDHAEKATDDQITPGVSRLIRGNSWYISNEELDQMRYEYLMEKYK